MDDDSKYCPCCGDYLLTQQVNRHISWLLYSMKQELGEIDPDFGNNQSHGDNGGGPRAKAKPEDIDNFSDSSSAIPNNNNNGNRDEGK
jgi:hypothetical protein